MKRKYFVANISGGKDSMAMLLLIYIKGYPIDEVVFFDTGWEFDCIYENIKSVEHLCYLANIKFTVIKPDKSFDFLMFEHPHKTRKGENVFGYSWCGGVCRWGTTQKT